MAQIGLILFRILHWLLWCSPFGSSSYHLRKNCRKPPKNRSKLQLEVLIARDWDILRANGHLRWTRLKTFYKININCFFRKNSPSGLNLTSNFGPNSDKMFKIQNFHKSCSNRAYFVQKNLLIIFPKSVFVYLLPPTQRKG